MTHNIDLTELQDEVMEHWENEGIDFTITENVGYSEPDPTFYMTTLQPWAESVLDDVSEMIDALGFDSIANYILSKQQEAV